VADNASVYFQALDGNYMEVRRMRSSISFQPGERRSCNGCHETQSKSIASGPQQGLAARREPDMPSEPRWGCRDIIGFDELVQPVLDEHCVRCHGAAPLPTSGGKPKPHLDFTKGKAYGTITRGLVAISSRSSSGSITSTKQFGSHKSRLITQLLKKDTPCRADLSEDDWITLVTWVDANAPNRGTMHSKRTADGRNWVWERHEWKDPWAQPMEVPARGQVLNIPRNKWLDQLEAKKK